MIRYRIQYLQETYHKADDCVASQSSICRRVQSFVRKQRLDHEHERTESRHLCQIILYHRDSLGTIIRIDTDVHVEWSFRIELTKINIKHSASNLPRATTVGNERTGTRAPTATCPPRVIKAVFSIDDIWNNDLVLYASSYTWGVCTTRSMSLSIEVPVIWMRFTIKYIMLTHLEGRGHERHCRIQWLRRWETAVSRCRLHERWQVHEHDVLDP